MMLEIFVGLVTPIVLYFIYFYFQHLRTCMKLPPGPCPLPIIGNFHLLSVNTPYKSMSKLAKIYGDVFGLSFASQRVVVVSGAEAIRQVLITDSKSYADKIHYHSANLYSKGGQGLVFSNYTDLYQLSRRRVLSALQFHSDQLNQTTNLISEECLEVCKRFMECSGSPTNPRKFLEKSIINIICKLAFGKKSNFDGKRLDEVTFIIGEILESISATSHFALMPWLSYIPSKKIRDFVKAIGKRDDFIREEILTHVQTYNRDNIKDLTDVFLKLSSEKEKNEFNEENLTVLLGDIFIGGSDTTLTVILLFMLYMLKWPEHQEIMYKEIIREVVDGSLPTNCDRKNLHYTNAILQEVLRFASFVPLLMRKVSKDVTLKDYNLPKGTLFMINLWDLHHDPEYWKDPEEFQPRRWLDDQGKFTVKNSSHFLPFSAGVRMCIGEKLARTEIFLFTTYIVRNFRLSNNPKKQSPDLGCKMGLVLSPPEFEVVFDLREDHLIN